MIWPLTHRIMSTKFANKWTGPFLGVLFLALVAYVQIVWENSEKDPNYYELLDIQRGDTLATQKKICRKLSLELHPDKTRYQHDVDAAAADALFHKVQVACEGLAKNRDLYELLGDAGIKAAAFDYNTVVVEMLVFYVYTSLYAVITTLGDASAAKISFFALACILLCECLLVLQKWRLPYWLFPYSTAHDVAAMLRRLFPAFMNGCRTFLEAVSVDPSLAKIAALSRVSADLRTRSSIISSTNRLAFKVVGTDNHNNDHGDFLDAARVSMPISTFNTTTIPIPTVGLVEAALSCTRRRLAYSDDDDIDVDATITRVAQQKETLSSPNKVANSRRGYPCLELARNTVLFIAARMALSYFKSD